MLFLNYCRSLALEFSEIYWNKGVLWQGYTLSIYATTIQQTKMHEVYHIKKVIANVLIFQTSFLAMVYLFRLFISNLNKNFMSILFLWYDFVAYHGSDVNIWNTVTRLLSFSCLQNFVFSSLCHYTVLILL